MMDTEQIIQEIQSLPTDAQRTLVERIVREFGGASNMPYVVKPSPCVGQ